MTIDRAALLDAIPRLAGRHILVVGDILLDEYLFGTAARLSREAPVPVLEFERRQVTPGGAANPAMNIAAQGSRVTVVGLIGADAAGEELISQLHTAQIATAGVVVDDSRCTTQKTRVISQGSLRFPQQLARLDRVKRHPPAPEIEAALLARLKTAAVTCDAVLVSDYRNGMLTPALVQEAITQAQRNNCLLLVDSQGKLDKYRGYDLIRANHRDTAAYLNRQLRSEDDFRAAAATLLAQLQARGIVIGRGAQGVSLLGQDTPYRHFQPANVTEVFDVTGAGDTSIALLALGMVSGLNLAEAAFLANVAAGLVVQKLGNATPTPQELAVAIRTWG